MPATMLDVHVLKRHRKLPVEERPRWHLLGMTAELRQAYLEMSARVTGAAVDGSSSGDERKQVEVLEVAENELFARLSAHVHQMDGGQLHDPNGEPLVYPSDPELRPTWYRRNVPLKDARELMRVCTGEIDPEDE